MRRIIPAIILSIAIHVFILSFLPETEARTEPISIRVSLRNIPAPTPPTPLPQAPEPPQKTETPPPPDPQPEVKEIIKEVKEVKKIEPPKKVPPKVKQPAKAEPPKEPEPKVETQTAEAAAAQRAPATSAPAVSSSANSQIASPAAPSVSSAIIDVSRLTVTKKISPEYPMLSRKRRDQGTVTLIVTIKSGRVSDVKVESSSGHAPLDDSAARAVRGWEFDSSGYGDVITARIPFVFKLQ
ncbi:MAG: TonB family protein [Synergistaceae bacterium]|jgi:protein TonB|nr:TonB family protein [Synergistaceae bacterium]